MIEFYKSMTDNEPMKCELDTWDTIPSLVLTVEKWFEHHPTGKIVLNSGILNHKTALIKLK